MSAKQMFVRYQSAQALDNSGGAKGPAGEIHERSLQDGGEEIYREWASDYDHDVKSADYVGPRNLSMLALKELKHGKWVGCILFF